MERRGGGGGGVGVGGERICVCVCVWGGEGSVLATFIYPGSGAFPCKSNAD